MYFLCTTFHFIDLLLIFIGKKHPLWMAPFRIIPFFKNQIHFLILNNKRDIILIRDDENTSYETVMTCDVLIWYKYIIKN